MHYFIILLLIIIFEFPDLSIQIIFYHIVAYCKHVKLEWDVGTRMPTGMLAVSTHGMLYLR